MGSADRIIGRELSGDESLHWSGQPLQGFLLQPQDALLIPFSLMWGGFAIFWEYSVISSGAPFFFKLWGIPFVLVGIYIIFGRFLVDAERRRHTWYGLTSKRVVIVSGIFTQTVKSLNLRTLTDVTLTERRNGTGTIALGPTPQWQTWYAGTGWLWMGASASPVLESIECAKEVYNRIVAAQKGAT